MVEIGSYEVYLFIEHSELQIWRSNCFDMVTKPVSAATQYRKQSAVLKHPPPQKPRPVIWLGLLLTIMLSHTVSAGPTLGEPILGGRLLVANDGYVTAEFLGSDAGYFNSLYLHSPNGAADFLFNKRTPLDVGPVELGWFSAGSELIFRLDVRNTGLSFFTGDAGRNIDGIAHALATTILDDAATYITEVGFEDLRGGGDLDPAHPGGGADR